MPMKSKLILLFLIIFQQSACAQQIEKNGFEISDKLLSCSQKDIGEKRESFNREVWNYDSEGNEDNYTLDKGIVFKFIKESKANSIFQKYHKEVIESGNYLFLTNMDFDDSYKTYYDIVIINCSDQFELIKLIGTNGVNYDVYNDDIVTQMKEWHKEVDFTIDVVDIARIHAYMEKTPKNIKQFASCKCLTTVFEMRCNHDYISGNIYVSFPVKCKFKFPINYMHDLFIHMTVFRHLCTLLYFPKCQ